MSLEPAIRVTVFFIKKCVKGDVCTLLEIETYEFLCYLLLANLARLEISHATTG